MRVTTGTAKNHKISVPENIRPTKDMVRQAIFNIIGPDIEGADVVDLFAGSGALGLEALSRGAGYCVFVDYSSDCTRAIETNISRMSFEEVTEVYQMRTIDYIAMTNNECYDIIFADPPYDYEKLEKLVRKCEKILKPNGILVLEHLKKKEIRDNKTGTLQLIDSRVYGVTKISFFYKE